MKNKNCQNCKKDFVIDVDDKSFYQKMNVPAPTFCPECRMARRFAFRNQRKLFKINDHFTGESIFSLIPPESGMLVVTKEEWFSDSWDAMDQALDIDFSKPFLQQLFELHKKVPQINLNVTRMINSPYSGNANDLKNCYMVFGAAINEDCMYSTGIYDSKNCVDNCNIDESEFCYENFWIKNCNKTRFSEECTQCSGVWFSKNLVGCMNCVGCVNLRNKSYCIFNKQYTKEEYEAELKKLNLNTYDGIQSMKIKSKEFWTQFPKKYSQGVKNINSSGVYVTNSKNTKNCYFIDNGEDLKYSQFIFKGNNKDCYDISVWGDNSELAYEYSSSGSGIYNSKFIVDCWPNIRNVEYSLHCSSISDCFGCIGLRNKQYCILNKQYTKEEYEELLPKIKQFMSNAPYVDKNGLKYEYGEFFPIEFSWYGYNNTLAQEFFPISKDEAISNGYTWFETPKGEYMNDFIAQELPQSINEVNENFINKIIECGNCKSSYKIIKEEYEFLKRENLPLPQMCPDCRYNERIVSRIKPFLYKMSCMKQGCNNEFETGYNPNEGNIVYCELCYQQEII